MLDLDPIDSSDGDLSSADMGDNTIAIKFRAPKDSSRFSLNITTSDGARDGYDDVLFHFNPRQFKKGGQLILKGTRFVIHSPPRIGKPLLKNLETVLSDTIVPVRKQSQ